MANKCMSTCIHPYMDKWRDRENNLKYLLFETRSSYILLLILGGGEREVEHSENLKSDQTNLK